MHCKIRRSACSVLVLSAVLALGLGAPSVFAANCIQDQWKADGNNQKLTCTANDVRVASAGNIRDLDGEALDTCTAGSTFSFIADFDVVLGAQARYDIGLYFAIDGDEDGTGDGAITGLCSVNIIEPLAGSPVPLGSPNFVQLDAVDQPDDVCGDIDADNNPQIVTVQVDNVICQDADGDELLDLPNCTSWRQGGANEVCLSDADAFPGSPSKCNCDPDFNIGIMVEAGDIAVTKSAAPASLPEPGGTFTFTVHVQNEAQFTDVDLNRICDSDHGEIVDSSGVGCAAGSIGAISSTTCGDPTWPVTLTPDDGLEGGTDEYTCTFDAEITSSMPVDNEQDTVTVYGIDETDNEVSASDTASVAITDVAPTAMVTKAFDEIKCATVTYDVDVENTSTAEALTLTALNDSAFGSVTELQGDVAGTTCGVDDGIGSQSGQSGAGAFPASVEIGATYSCSFDAKFCGSMHTNSATATLNDNDEPTEITATSDSVTVTVSGSQQ